jgi:hypothetical protein
MDVARAVGIGGPLLFEERQAQARSSAEELIARNGRAIAPSWVICDKTATALSGVRRRALGSRRVLCRRECCPPGFRIISSR